MIQYLKTILSHDSTTDSPSIICKLHYRYIKNFFLFAFTLCLSRQLFGDSILCHRDRQGISENYLHTTCFMNGTYTDSEEWGRLYYNYYQWVPVLLLLESFMFYLPYHVWIIWIHFIPTINSKNAENVLNSIRQHGGQYVFWKAIALDWMYFCNFLLQALFINSFLNNGIWRGVSWEHLFPWNVKCNVDYHTGSGITTGKFNCILPLNVIYVILFKIMYIGFWVILGLHGMVIPYQIMLVYFRKKTFWKDIHQWWLYTMIEQNTHGEAFWNLKNALHTFKD